jgi:nitrate reductase gamma subunit
MKRLKIAQMASIAVSSFSLLIWCITLWRLGWSPFAPYVHGDDIVAKELGLGLTGGWLFALFNYFYPFAYFIFCIVSSFSLLSLRTLKIFGVAFHVGILGLIYLVAVLWFTPVPFFVACMACWFWMLKERSKNEKSNKSLQPTATAPSVLTDG